MYESFHSIFYTKFLPNSIKVTFKKQTFNTICKIDDRIILPEMAFGMNAFINLPCIEFIGTNNKTIRFITQKTHIG